MSLVTEVVNLATRVATEIKAVRTLVNGNAAGLSALTTTDKTNLVNALNELKSAVDSVSGSAGIDDGATGTATTWSSTKINAEVDAAIAALVNGAPAAMDTLNELATELTANEGELASLLTAVGNRVRFDAAQALDATQQAQARTNIGAGIGDSDLVIGTTAGTAADAAAVATSLAGKANTTHTHTAAQVSDATTTGRAVMTAASATAARTAIGAGTSNLVIGTTAGTAADAGATNTALATKVSADTATQGLTALQQQNARTNISAVGTADIGDPNTNFVTVFEAGLV